MKGQEVVFSSQSDQWKTPLSLFEKLNQEFNFVLDGAADTENHLCPYWLGPGSPSGEEDALATNWGRGPVFVNPPYSRVKEFTAKCHEEQQRGCTSVLLIPSRTDTKYWHNYIWSEEYNTWRPGVEGRFIKGRLKFTESTQTTSGNSAPFPSVIVIFRGRPR